MLSYRYCKDNKHIIVLCDIKSAIWHPMILITFDLDFAKYKLMHSDLLDYYHIKHVQILIGNSI